MFKLDALDDRSSGRGTLQGWCGLTELELPLGSKRDSDQGAMAMAAQWRTSYQGERATRSSFEAAGLQVREAKRG